MPRPTRLISYVLVSRECRQWRAKAGSRENGRASVPHLLAWTFWPWLDIHIGKVLCHGEESGAGQDLGGELLVGRCVWNLPLVSWLG